MCKFDLPNPGVIEVAMSPSERIKAFSQLRLVRLANVHLGKGF